MREPWVHLAYAPRGAGLLCALFWFAADDHVYGWFTGAKAHEQVKSFFMLEDYYSKRQTVCYRSAQDDPYGDWLVCSTEKESRIDRPIPVSTELCHELGRMQDAFVREWLLFEGGQDYERQAEALHARGLPALAANIRPSRIDKLATSKPVWTYSSPGADAHVVAFLAKRWPLDYRAD